VSDRRSGQGIDDVETELELLRVVHRAQHRKHADAVADEVRRVLRMNHALAQRRREEGLESIEHRAIRVIARNQLDKDACSAAG
jgi:hypothetical protein